jgi:hypothetical protein
MVRLAADPAHYDALRGALEASRVLHEGHSSGGVWDAKAYARHLVDGLFAAWDHHLSGQPPRDVHAASA